MAKKEKRQAWERTLWGVRFTGSLKSDEPMLLGAAWADEASPGRGRASDCLVFGSRRSARAWCQAQRAKYQGRSDCCKHWKFQPVKVRERIEVIE